MGALQLSEFRDQLEVTFGERGLSSTILNQWVNFGYLELVTGLDFEILDNEFTFNTAVGDRDYTGPTDPLVIKFLRNETQDETLTWVPKEEFFRLPSATNGTPKRWTRHLDEIFVYPKPTAIESMLAVYKDEPTELSNDTDVTVIPATWDQAIINLSTSHGYMVVGEENRAVVWYQKAVNYINSRMSEDNLSRGTAGLFRAFNLGESDGVLNPPTVQG